MTTTVPSPSITAREMLTAWGRVLAGNLPMISIEITRECPLSCPGCYAYGDKHLGGGVTLSELDDYRGDKLVDGVIGLVRKHKAMHVSLVGGEPMIRRRELSRILPVLSEMGVFTLLVTSGVIPVPPEWMKIPRLRVAISIDGLPEHHDIRRKPATYERILKNIAGCTVNVHWTITRPMLARESYLKEYVSFWSERPELNCIWVSGYTPQIGEQSAEMMTAEDRAFVGSELPRLAALYPKLQFKAGIAGAFLHPPKDPHHCLFAKMSANYSADLESRVEPCVFGGNPDCGNCGCSASMALHWIRGIKLAGGVKVNHFIGTSMKVGTLVSRLRSQETKPTRWAPGAPAKPSGDALVQIQS
ncbi:MAG TPA: radical SAM protein [Candidatus Acidoferrales bacterium]|nr:radical SAM protein [Candidatus Acidoferrales bacterium]